MIPNYGTSDWLLKYPLNHGFSTPSNPSSSYPFNNGVHYGLDFDLNYNEPVRAVTDGKIRTWYDTGGGNAITIIEPDGVHYQWYLHLNSFAVKSGDTVKAGQIIGYSGNSGNMTTGAHLHFQRMYGNESNAAAIDPMPFLLAIQNRQYNEYSDTGYNPDSTVGDWTYSKSRVIFRKENGKFTVTKNDGTNVYSYPTNESEYKYKLPSGTTVNYDYKYINDGYVWISYMKDNVRYYAQAGFSGDNLSYKDGTVPFGSIAGVNYGRTSFSDTIYDPFQGVGEWRKTASGITFRTENGRFKVTKPGGTAYYSAPNNDGQQSGTVEYSQYLIYDYKYINDGYVWLGFEKNGQRYYVQAGFSDGQYSYKEGSVPFGTFY